jgi:transposase
MRSIELYGRKGFRIGGKTRWLHVACTKLLTFYRVCAKRGALLTEVVKVACVVVHDHWKPYTNPR